MITVATKLDVPIKLSFESASRSSILGLGDIVVPGMMIALALRFDHWLHYYRQIKHESLDLKQETRNPETGSVEIKSETQVVNTKPTYVDLTGAWGDWFWTSTWQGLFTKPNSPPPSVAGASFKKTYFYVSMAGYTLGMLVTMAMLIIFQHGQPALLYLVPSVLGSLWLTGYLRGELHEMLTYTEDGSLDTKMVVVEVDKDGQVVKEVKEVKSDTDEPVDTVAQKLKDTQGISSAGSVVRTKRPRYIFLFSIQAADDNSKEHEE
jgi:minor histocompatibility antigen H13